MQVKLTCQGVRLEVNRTHYLKLRALYGRYNPPPAKEKKEASGQGDKAKGAEYKQTSVEAVFCLLARYSALQGTHYRGGGFQVNPKP